MTVTEAPRGSDSADAPAEQRPVRPVIGWAVLGVAVIALQLYIFADYVFSGTLAKGPVATGPDPVPTYMMVGCRAFEVLFTFGLVTFAYRCVIRPWRRERKLGVEGMLFLAGLTVFWQDPLYSYTQHAFTYNAAFLNIRSWGDSIPGSMAPHAGHIRLSRTGHDFGLDGSAGVRHEVGHVGDGRREETVARNRAGAPRDDRLPGVHHLRHRHGTLHALRGVLHVAGCAWLDSLSRSLLPVPDV